MSISEAIERIMLALKDVSELSGYTQRVADMLKVFEDVANQKYVKCRVKEGAEGVVDVTNMKGEVFVCLFFCSFGASVYLFVYLFFCCSFVVHLLLFLFVSCLLFCFLVWFLCLVFFLFRFLSCLFWYFSVWFVFLFVLVFCILIS